jgi:hypothetical protein
MTTIAASPHRSRRVDGTRTAHVLLHDDLGLLTVRRLRPWHRMLARCTAARLDRELAAGTSPEASATLAARAMLLTSVNFRRDLATSVHRLLAAAGEQAAGEQAAGEPAAGKPAAGEPAAVTPAPARAARPPRIPLNRARIRQSARPLASLAGQLAKSGPVPVPGVAMISLLLADGMGPLYHDARGDDLDDIIAKATRALSLPD